MLLLSLFVFPLKSSKRFSLCFQGVQKKTSGSMLTQTRITAIFRFLSTSRRLWETVQVTQMLKRFFGVRFFCQNGYFLKHPNPLDAQGKDCLWYFLLQQFTWKSKYKVEQIHSISLVSFYTFPKTSRKQTNLWTL